MGHKNLPISDFRFTFAVFPFSLPFFSGLDKRQSEE